MSNQSNTVSNTARFLVSLSMALLCASAQAQSVPDWPDLYDPFSLYSLHVETVNAADFDLIRNDTTYDIEVPAWFWAGDEEPILVSIRRKSASALPNELDPNKKVSYKIDINEYHDDPDDVDICVDVPGITQGCVSKWKSVKKLSLENGDDQDVAQEGVAWYLHRLAAESGLQYETGLASWVKLYINGQYQGVYVNVEQPDKQFLKNRDMWEPIGDTWLTKMSDRYDPEPKQGPEDESGIPSPTSEALCFAPFLGKGKCPTPSDFKDQLNERINMEGMLTFGAVSAFHYSPDDLFSNSKNFYYVDQGDGLDPNWKRQYLQWDLDSAFGSLDPNISIYRNGRGNLNQYERALVDDEDDPFREEYNEIVRALVDGDFPIFDAVQLSLDMQAFQSLLSSALAEDPNSKDAAGSFSTMAEYFPLRIASVRDQLPAGPPPPPSEDDIHVGDIDGDAAAAAQNNWVATVTVTIHDYQHIGVAGAGVSGTWSNGISGDTSCTTDSSGQCQLVATVTKKRFKKVSFSIASASLSGAVYASSQNHDDDGDSDGNSITIDRP